MKTPCASLAWSPRGVGLGSSSPHRTQLEANVSISAHVQGQGRTHSCSIRRSYFLCGSGPGSVSAISGFVWWMRCLRLAGRDAAGKLPKLRFWLAAAAGRQRRSWGITYLATRLSGIRVSGPLCIRGTTSTSLRFHRPVPQKPGLSRLRVRTPNIIERRFNFRYTLRTPPCNPRLLSCTCLVIMPSPPQNIATKSCVSRAPRPTSEQRRS